MIRNMKRVKIGLVVSFVICIVLELVNDTSYFDDTPYFEIDDELIKRESNGSRCSVFNRDVKPFRVQINGVKYPHENAVPLYERVSFNYDCMNRNKESKLILLWTTWFGDPTFAYGLGKHEPFINNKCPVYNCEITNDPTRLNESDLVLFHMRDPIRYMPKRDRKNQRWVFYLHESPLNTNLTPEYELNNVFNLSATYKLNSDFVSLYYEHAKFVWKENFDFNVNQDFSDGKIRLAYMVVSNCGDKSKRLYYIQELSNYMQVHVYGKCGIQCPVVVENDKEVDCKMFLSRYYKFYLAFENSICDDYITEKFFGVLRYNIIPIVYGGGKYDAYIPKSGYINALDYKTPKHLSNYLLYLDSNKEAYNSYFKWKRYITPNVDGPIGPNVFCEMCIRLNLEARFGVKKSRLNNIEEYWGRKENCKSVEIKDDFALSLSPYRQDDYGFEY